MRTESVNSLGARPALKMRVHPHRVHSGAVEQLTLFETR